MSTIYFNDQETGPTFSKGCDISLILNEDALKNCTSVQILLTEPGEYLITRAIQFWCDVTIEGCLGAVIKFKNPTADACPDDCLIHFNYKQNEDKSYIRPNVVIRDVEFEIEIEDGKTKKDGNLYYLKFYWAQSVVIERVKMVINGINNFTNIDIRDSKKITVKGCILENYHKNDKLHHEGGILWFRGETSNVQIAHNQFKKSGNDEALAFWGHFKDVIHSPKEKAYFQVIPVGQEPGEVCTKAHIVVRDNIFVYAPDYSSKDVDYNDCLITLYDLVDAHKDNNNPNLFKFLFEDIHFENNTFFINGLCRRIVGCGLEEDSQLNDVVFKGNHFNIGAFSETDDFLNVFNLTNKYSGINANYQIVGNTVYNSAAISRFSDNDSGLCFLFQNGGNVLVKGNTIRVNSVNDNKSDSRKMRFFWNNYLDCKLTVQDNYAEGIYMFGSLDCPVESNLSSTLLVRNNIIKGDTRIYCNNLNDMDIRVEDNHFVCEKDVIALQNGDGSNFIYTHNHVVVTMTSKIKCSFCNADLNKSINITGFCVVNNVFEKASETIMANVDSKVMAANKIITNNRFIN